jgi:hypothetical protein
MYFGFHIDVASKDSQLCLDTSPLFFHMITKLVQALSTVCDEIFHAMEVENDVTMEGYLTRVHTTKEQKKPAISRVHVSYTHFPFHSCLH